MSQDTGFHERTTYDDGTEIQTYPIEHPNKQAQIAVEILTRWAIVAAQVDGEDSAGRQKVRNMSAEEMAQAACDSAAALWKQFRARGWLLDLPAPKLGKRASLGKSVLDAATTAANDPS